MHSWQSVLEAVRKQKRDWVRCWGEIDMIPYWRVLAFRDHDGKPEAIVRAQGFARVLENVRIHTYAGERITGSKAGVTGFAYPNGQTADEVEQNLLVPYYHTRKHRGFTHGWDHTVADYRTLLAIGIRGYLERITASLATHAIPREQAILHAMRITLEALATFIRRHAEVKRREGNAVLADALEWIAAEPPRTFLEAMQLTWLVYIAFVFEHRGHMALGRLDQYLYPFYQCDLAEGRLTREEALELICHLWVHIEEIGQITNIAIGGLTPEGDDGTNDLSYLCLEATRLVQSPSTNLSARFHDGTPLAFHHACFETVRTGVGFPAIFNDHVLVPGLQEISIPIEVARDHCMVGCIETMLAGRQQAWSDSRFNPPVFLNEALFALRDQDDLTYEILYQEVQARIAAGITEHCRMINGYIAECDAENAPDPFLSALTCDCIGRARDINDGGAEFKRFHGVCVMGLANMADSLAAVKKLVFTEHRLNYATLLDALEADFQGYEDVQQLLLRQAPKYGNDDPYVDEIACEIVDFTSRECLKHEIVGGGRFVSAMAANVSNIDAGKEVGATADGRRAGTPLSDAASPYFGRDEHGPTAFLNSVAKPDYHLVLTGSVINMKFDPIFFHGPEGRDIFAAFTQFFVKQRIPELQFNFTGNALLREAQAHPEQHRHLVVRVSGFSAYFVDLTREVQDDVIRRRVHFEESTIPA